MNSACQREGHHQRRRHQEIRLDMLMHARFEIPVPGKNRSRNQIVFVDRFLDVWMQRPGVADAGRAAVTDKIKPELIEIFLQPGFRQIIGDHARTRRERRFHCRIHVQSALDRLFCEQTGREHHARIARVRATRDGRDENAAVADMAASAHENFARLRFYLLPGIGRRPVCHHLDFVAFVARIDSLILLFVRRSHLAVARRAAIQFHNMFFAKVDILFSRIRRRAPVSPATREMFFRARAN